MKMRGGWPMRMVDTYHEDERWVTNEDGGYIP